MPRSAEKTFTSRMIPGLPPGERGGTWYTAKDMPGFILRTFPSGEKTFAVRYRVKATGRRTVVSLGAWGLVTYAQAHAKAKTLLAQAALGEDPRPRERVTTWAAWVTKYFARGGGKKGAWKKPEEQSRYLGLSEETTSKRGAAANPIFREIRASWANRTLDSFTPEDIEDARQDVRERGRILANRWLATIAACFASAVKSELLSRNPCVNVNADRENQSRDRVLSADERKRFLVAADAERDPHARAALLLLAMTGARSGEILATEWEHVDLERRLIRLPDSKSGKVRLIPLPPPAVELLRTLPRLGKYVVAGRDLEKPRVDLKGVWKRIAKSAALVGVTPHDLRRTWGLEMSRVAGIRIASRGLGHTSIAITESTYTPEGFAAIQDAADAVAGRLLPEAPEAQP